MATVNTPRTALGIHTHIGAFLESLANILVQLIVHAAFDQGNHIYSLENIGDDPY